MTSFPSATLLRKRKFFLMLPVLAIPFLTLLFWALGGGKTPGLQEQAMISEPRLNLELPPVNTREHPGWTKLDYYHQADADSAKRRAERARDPYYDLSGLPRAKEDSLSLLDIDPRKSREAHTAKAYAQLEALDKQLNAVEVRSDRRSDQPGRPASSVDLARLEAMTQVIRSKNTAPDPEMEQLNGLLSTLLDIQHPERVAARLEDSLNKQGSKAYRVEVPNDSLQSGISGNVFYSLDNPQASSADNTIAAVITDQQTLISGRTIKLQLAQDVAVNGILVPAQTSLNGQTQLNGERLLVTVKTIRTAQAILPVQLTVFDLDGQAGISIPGAMTREVAKQSARQSVQSIGLHSLDPSLATRAADVGLQAAKNLVGSAVRQVKVTVPSGYQVLLKSSH